MSEITPMSRAQMQELRSQKEEEIRLSKIKNIVEEIYKEAMKVATTTTESSYNHEVPSAQTANLSIQQRSLSKQDYLRQKAHYQLMDHRRKTAEAFKHSYTQDDSDPFHVKNMKDILAGLQVLFPECKVTHTLMARKNDGTLYDISKFDDSVLPLVNELLQESYIVIDWS